MSQRKKAFTLIELLVVIAIIAVLMGILMPALRKAKQAAHRITCGANQKGLGVAFIAYTQDNDNWSHWGPNRGYWYVNERRGGSESEYGEMQGKDEKWAYWGIAYYPYAQNMEVFHCPSSKYQLQTWGSSADMELYRWAHYGLNGFVSNRKVSRVKRPGEMIVVQDHFEQKLDNNGDMLHINPEKDERYNLWQWRVEHRLTYPDALIEIYRHSRTSLGVTDKKPYYPKGTGYCNTLWLDGHVSSIRQSDGQDVPYQWYTGGPGKATTEAWITNEADQARATRWRW